MPGRQVKRTQAVRKERTQAARKGKEPSAQERKGRKVVISARIGKNPNSGKERTQAARKEERLVTKLSGKIRTQAVRKGVRQGWLPSGQQRKGSKQSPEERSRAVSKGKESSSLEREVTKQSEK